VLGRLWRKLLVLWRLAKSERATPREIFWAVFLGVFAGCTPAIGFHTWVALGLATLFRKNRLIAWLGSRVSIMLFLPFIIYTEVGVAHLARTGSWVAIELSSGERAIAQARELLLDWCLGVFPVGAALGATLGAIAWAFARRRDRLARALAPATSPTPAPPSERPAPSSGSPA
jgi:uncharacterized protein (DUF2062 family)